MANQTINIGSVANDGTGDTLRVAFGKINDNFAEVYTDISDLSNTVNTIPSDISDLADASNLLISSNTYTVSNITSENNLSITAAATYDVTISGGSANTGTPGTLILKGGSGLSSGQNGSDVLIQAGSTVDGSNGDIYIGATNTNRVYLENIAEVVGAAGATLNLVSHSDENVDVIHISMHPNGSNPVTRFYANNIFQVSSTTNFQSGAVIDFTGADIRGLDTQDLTINTVEASIVSANGDILVDANTRSFFYEADDITNWSGNSAPTTIGDAIDRLAAAIKTLNGTGA